MMPEHAGSFLFISLDLIGSTEYKRNNIFTWPTVFSTFAETIAADIEAEWLDFVERFNPSKIFSLPVDVSDLDDGIARVFTAELEQMCEVGSNANNYLRKAPVKWKAAGDEVILVKQITSTAELITTISFIRTFLSNNPKFEVKLARGLNTLDKRIDLSAALNLKCACWLTNADRFDSGKRPEGSDRQRQGRNIYIPGAIADLSMLREAVQTAISSSNLSLVGDDGKVIDNEEIRSEYIEGILTDFDQFLDDIRAREFLGPEVDEGFRICKFARANFIAISSHLALWLSQYSSVLKTPAPFFVGHGDDLKGVKVDGPYPPCLIAVDDTRSLASDTSIQGITDLVGELRPVAAKDLCQALKRFTHINEYSIGDPAIYGVSQGIFRYFNGFDVRSET